MRIKALPKIVSRKKDNQSPLSSDNIDNILYIAGQNHVSGDIVGYQETIFSESSVAVGLLYAEHITIDQGAVIKASEIASKQVDVNGEFISNEATIDNLALFEHASLEGSFNVINLESIAGAKIKANISTYWQKPKHHSLSSKITTNTSSSKNSNKPRIKAKDSLEDKL
jgi:cytoskeletal protein CcmA (bactofilin family)